MRAVATEPRQPRVRLWVVALVVVGCDLVSRAIFAARGMDYVATPFQIFAYGVVWMLGLCRLVFRSYGVRFILWGLLWELFTVAAALAVFSGVRS